jgi:hypothetical protein
MCSVQLLMATTSQKKSEATADASPENVPKNCQLQQFTMFDCDREVFETKGIVKCYPIPRVFRVYVSIHLNSYFEHSM